MCAASCELCKVIDPRDLRDLLREIIYSYSVLALKCEDADREEIVRHLFYLKRFESLSVTDWQASS